MTHHPIPTRTGDSSPLPPAPTLRLNPLAAVLAAGLFTLGMVPAGAATLHIGVGGCTLVDAITAANIDLAAGACPAGNGADTLVLPSASTLTLSAVNNTELAGPTGLPVITSSITIQGNGSRILRNPGAGPFRILAVNDTGTLSLERTTISGGLTLEQAGAYDGAGILNLGTLTLVDTTVSGNSAVGSGGGIQNEGVLSLVSSTVSGNSAVGRGAGIENLRSLSLVNSTVSGNTSGNRGGGVYSFNGYESAGSGTTLHGSTVSGNTSMYEGGGLFVRFGTLGLINSSVSGNTSGGDGGGYYGGYGGGGIYGYRSQLSLSSSTVSGNTGSGSGGGIRGESSVLIVSNTTISDNSSGEAGGGIASAGELRMSNSTVSGNRSGQEGGGIRLSTSDGADGPRTSTIGNSTLSGNSAPIGGGLFNLGGSTLISHSTITDNTAPIRRGAGLASAERPYSDLDSVTTLAATIVAGNQGTDVDLLRGGSEDPGHGGVGRFVSLGDNLIGDGNATGSFMASGDQTRVPNPRLAALTHNGGPTRTHALNRNSPAIDAAGGHCQPQTPLDQRGFTRPSDGDSSGTARCDIGAFELRATAAADGDADQVPDVIDTCPLTANPDQADTDQDGSGDACDASPLGLCEGRIVTIRGTAGDDELSGTPGDDVIAGLGGDDRVEGLAGNDLICGGAGNDVLEGGDGRDRLFAGDGADRLLGGRGGDILHGGGGQDSLNGGSGDDACDGGAATDTARACEQLDGVP
ncbi:MAG: choice-of-anchor Q domain-containing protein [Panacagrimonas sp.]